MRRGLFRLEMLKRYLQQFGHANFASKHIAPQGIE